MTRIPIAPSRVKCAVILESASPKPGSRPPTASKPATEECAEPSRMPLASAARRHSLSIAGKKPIRR